MDLMNKIVNALINHNVNYQNSGISKQSLVDA